MTLEEFTSWGQIITHRLFITHNKCPKCKQGKGYEIVHGKPYYRNNCRCPEHPDRQPSTWPQMYQALKSLNQLPE